MATRKERLRFTIQRFINFLAAFKRTKRGVFGVAILIIFTLVAVIAPFITTHDPVRETFVAGELARPDWYDQVYPDPQSRNINPITNPGFDDSSSINFNITTTSDLIRTYHVASIGKKAPGSLAVAFRRTGTNPHGKPDSVNITYEFNYPYQAPLARFSATAQFLIEGSTFVTEPTTGRQKVALDIPVNISMSIKRIENGTITGQFDFFKQLYDLRHERLIPSPVTEPTNSWLPKDPAKLDSFYMRGTIKGKYVDPARLIMIKPSNFIYSIEITFLDMNSTKSNVETVVYVDDLNLKGLGTAYGLFGTDRYGRDIYSQLVFGTRVSLLVGVMSALIAVGIGLVVGMVAGYQGGVIDELLMRVTDALLVIPGLPLLLVLVAVLGQNIWNLILLIGILGWMGFARIVRSMILSLKERPFIEAAKAVGAGRLHIMTIHILPNVMALVYVTLAMTVPSAIVSEAALSWLGFFDPNVMSWGRMLHDIQEGLNIDKWWWVVPPGLLISLVALAFILIGYALDDILNPRLRQRR